MLAGWGSPPSSRSGTRPTSPRTICSSGGRRTSRRGGAPLRRVVRESAPLRSSRPSGRAAQADTRAQERHLCERSARRQLAHGRACGLRGRRRRALPPGGSHSGNVARGADRRGDAALVSARAEGQARRLAHECRRARHPGSRRLRCGRARASLAPRRRSKRCASCSRPRRASRTRSTCSVGDRGDATSSSARPAGRPAGRRGHSCSSSRPSARPPTRLRSRSTQRPGEPPREAGARRRHELGGRAAGASVRLAAAAFAYPESAARALGRVAERAEWLRRPLGIRFRRSKVSTVAAAEASSSARSPAADDSGWIPPRRGSCWPPTASRGPRAGRRGCRRRRPGG